MEVTPELVGGGSALVISGLGVWVYVLRQEVKSLREWRHEFINTHFANLQLKVERHDEYLARVKKVINGDK